jgi:hypothetical protein
MPVDDDVDDAVDKRRYAGDNDIVPCGWPKNLEIVGAKPLCEPGRRQ